MTPPLHHLGVAELGRALRAKTVSSTELTQHLLARVAATKDLGAFLHIDEAYALSRARDADARLAQGEAGTRVRSQGLRALK